VVPENKNGLKIEEKKNEMKSVVLPRFVRAKSLLLEVMGG